MSARRKPIDLNEWSENLHDCASRISDYIERKQWDEMWEALRDLKALARKAERVKKVLTEQRGGPWFGWRWEPSIEHDAHSRHRNSLWCWAIPMDNNPDKWEFDIHPMHYEDDGSEIPTLAEHTFDDPAEGREWISWALKESGKHGPAVDVSFERFVREVISTRGFKATLQRARGGK